MPESYSQKKKPIAIFPLENHLIQSVCPTAYVPKKKKIQIDRGCRKLIYCGRI
jgi:hypothetical protein